MLTETWRSLLFMRAPRRIGGSERRKAHVLTSTIAATMAVATLCGCRQTADCSNACEQRIWPRLLIGFDPAGDAGANAVQVVQVKSAGEEWHPADATCPLLPPGTPCEFSAFVPGPSVQVHIATAAGRSIDTTVPVGAYNYCGREIGYLRVNLVDSTVTSEKTISPCETSGN